MVGDPLDVALAVVNVKTGKFVGDMLHRGIISQRVIQETAGDRAAHAHRDVHVPGAGLH